MSTEAAETHLSVPIPPKVKLHLKGRTIVAEGPLGTISRPYPNDALELKVAGANATLTLRIAPNRKRAKALLHTWERHLMNLFGGVTLGFEARMKVVAAHFPMKVSVKDTELLIENFLGEKYPRTASLIAGVSAKVEGDIVVLSGHDVELVGQSAANIERATRIRDYDPRVFQDGIYIVERARLREAS
jgi:large subunit ribosomal protein L6